MFFSRWVSLCLHFCIISICLFNAFVWSSYMMNVFSSRQRLHLPDSMLYAGACLMTLQLMSKSIPLLLSFQMWVDKEVFWSFSLQFGIWIERVVLLTGEIIVHEMILQYIYPNNFNWIYANNMFLSDAGNSACNLYIIIQENITCYLHGYHLSMWNSNSSLNLPRKIFRLVQTFWNRISLKKKY